MRNVLLCIVLASVAPAFGQELKVHPVTNPSAPDSIQQNWSAAPDGSVVLSWLELPEDADSYALRYAVRKGETWSEARTIVKDRVFFEHPAESPRVVKWNDHSWMAYWAESPDPGSEAENLYVSSSKDGVAWTEPALAHSDEREVQHGLASITQSGSGEISLTWLEGPEELEGQTHLRRTIMDASGKIVREEQLDSDVCECCPTSVVKTAKGLLVAYRDHTPDNIRDISVLRFENGKWTEPKNLHADNWKINACPINAASMTADGDHVALAWYTGAGNAPKVQLVFSENSGAAFTEPVVVSEGYAFGYASVVLGAGGNAVVSWLEREGENGPARLLARNVTPAGSMGPILEIAKGGRLGFGYPRLVRTGAEILAAWGSSEPGENIQTARLDLN